MNSPCINAHVYNVKWVHVNNEDICTCALYMSFYSRFTGLVIRVSLRYCLLNVLKYFSPKGLHSPTNELSNGETSQVC